MFIAHVRDGRIVRLDADDRPDDISAPQLRFPWLAWADLDQAQQAVGRETLIGAVTD